MRFLTVRQLFADRCGRKKEVHYGKRVSMGLTDRRKTTKNSVDSRKNWKILTVSRK